MAQQNLIRRNHPTQSERSYTAVVFFHGMGCHRRHEAISELVDKLDEYAQTKIPRKLGGMRSHEPVYEPYRHSNHGLGTEDAPTARDVAYLNFVRVSNDKQRKRPKGFYRVYEGFWAPLAINDYSAFRVLFWLIGRFFIPIIALIRAKWRDHKRLKLSTLYRMCAESASTKFQANCIRVDGLYRDFEDWSARHNPVSRTGKYRDFKRFVRLKIANEEHEKSKEVLDVVEDWFGRFLKEQVAMLVRCLTVGALVISWSLYLGISTLAFAGLAVPVFQRIWIYFPGAIQQPFIYPILFASVLLVTWLKARPRLMDSWADVMFWTTSREKDPRFTKRREILRAGEEILAHVLRDKQCERVVVIGHSLGSAIAYECLMSLGRKYRARSVRSSHTMPVELDRLRIISHLVTLGSPIDWIYYFFELQDSRYPHYNKIVEQLRGNTSKEPFFMGGDPNMRWINFWDTADPISGKLFSPLRPLPNQGSISDIEIASSHRPNFWSAHNSYWNSTRVLNSMYNIVMFGSLPAEAEHHARPLSYYSDLGGRMRSMAWLIMAVMPWLFTVLLASLLWNSHLGRVVSVILFVTCLIMLLIFHLFGAVLDRERPLTMRSFPQLWD